MIVGGLVVMGVGGSSQMVVMVKRRGMMMTFICTDTAIPGPLKIRSDSYRFSPTPLWLHKKAEGLNIHYP